MTQVRKRLDQILVEKGLIGARQRARGMIMAGMVRVDGRMVDKPGHLVNPSAPIDLVGPDHPYVSRGGVKLEAALGEFAIDVRGLTILDVGASTGGFTDCLLQHGAKKVFAVDVGYGQLAWSLRNDPRVVVLERTNIRHLSTLEIEDRIDGAVIDTSFISLRIVVPATVRVLKKDGFILALIKPQFEAGKGMVGKGGIVRDKVLQEGIVNDLIAFFSKSGLLVCGTKESPIRGSKGNREVFIYLKSQKRDDRLGGR
ncbi:MAG: TlyA family RNA methyltransferase [Deltaproteobacteria bacterium]|nr:MAG: TlyA family RNA methyltransferase [Deltaproteobacteria bacterium]